jgi:hypothetical protein
MVGPGEADHKAAVVSHNLHIGNPLTVDGLEIRRSSGPGLRFGIKERKTDAIAEVENQGLSLTRFIQLKNIFVLVLGINFSYGSFLKVGEEHRY